MLKKEKGSKPIINARISFLNSWEIVMKTPQTKVADCNSDSEICRRIQKLSFLRLITYGAQCLPKHQTMQYIPEMSVIEKFFHRDSIKLWRHEMFAYNRTLQRGVRMGLYPLRKAQLPLPFTTLDQYIVHMHGAVLSDTLDAMSAFAARVIPCIEQAPAAVMWPINGPLLITRDRWLLFCRGVLALLRLLDITSMCPSIPPSRTWPDADRLARSAVRIRVACGPFAAPRWRRAAISQRLPVVGRVMAAAAAASSAGAAAAAAAHSG
jgi:hypothetical protein